MEHILEAIYSSLPLLIIFVLLLIFFGVFIVFFLIKFFRIRSEIKKAILFLEELKRKVTGNVVDLDEISNGPMNTPELAHAWKEYTETLHPQYEVDESGFSRILRWRATTLAEIFFSDTSVISIPLKADFFKHLPGIFTGLGIIGTFSGLIKGLSSFNISNPSVAQLELKNLINAVGYAFLVSSFAIAFAMLIIVIEKSLLVNLHKHLSILRQIIDSMFDAGAGEEYLARLVTASETQATQAAHIKDALVADLKEILNNMTENQIREQSRQTEMLIHAQSEHYTRLSDNVGKAIAQSLGEPISNIAEAVKAVSANQGDAVSKLLTDVLADFTVQMRDMFGGQISGISDLLLETSGAIKESAEMFSSLAKNIENAGKNTVEEMGERLNVAIQTMESRQNSLNQEMRKFIGSISNIVEDSQRNSSQKLHETLSQLEEKVSEVIAQLRQESDAASESQEKRQQRFEALTDKMVNDLSLQIEALIKVSTETSYSLKNSVSLLANATDNAIFEMSHGAEILSNAAKDFAVAGQTVSMTMHDTAQTMDKLKYASDTINSTTSSLKDSLSIYYETNKKFSEITSQLNSIFENARRDGTMTSKIVAQFESAAQKLEIAQIKAEEFIKDIQEVLLKTHEEFSLNIGKTLREGNRSFQDELRQAVDIVSSAIKDLGDTLEEFPRRGD